MTDRKAYKFPQRSSNLTASKTPANSSHKKTVPRQKPQESSYSNRKNLMPEFERAEAESRAKEMNPKLREEEMSQMNESSISSSQLVEESVKLSVRQEDYAFQLPRSYILALSGLQQAIVQRDAQINKLQLAYEQERQLHTRLQAIKVENQKTLRQNEVKIRQLSTEIKILKEAGTEDRRTLAQLQRNRLDLERELVIAKETNTVQSTSQEKMLIELKSQLQRIQQEYQCLKQEKHLLRQTAEAARNELEQIKVKNIEAKEEQTNEVSKLTKELQKQKKMREQAEEEINILKKQVELLAQRTISAQQEQKQVIKQVAMRKPLIDIAFSYNQKKEEPIPRKVENIHPTQVSQKKTIIQKSNPSEKKDDLRTLHLTTAQHHRKLTDLSMISRDRSSSRARPRQNCPELVSQYRQLMRHEKELVGLNYQLQLLERGLARQGEDKGELQRGYQKLRRECEQKQLVINELKSFLNDPTR